MKLQFTHPLSYPCASDPTVFHRFSYVPLGLPLSVFFTVYKYYICDMMEHDLWYFTSIT